MSELYSCNHFEKLLNKKITSHNPIAIELLQSI